MLGENASTPSVRLTEEGVSKPSSVESEVESADAGEERADTRTFWVVPFGVSEGWSFRLLPPFVVLLRVHRAVGSRCPNERPLLRHSHRHLFTLDTSRVVCKDTTMNTNERSEMSAKGQYVFGRCEFCAAKGYEKRKLIQSPDGLRCSSCMTLVESIDEAIAKIITTPKEA